MSHKPWSNEDRESLFNVSLGFIDELEGSDSITADEPVIVSIHKEFGNVSRDLSSIIHRLAKMGFIDQRGPVFYRREISPNEVFCYSVHPDYKKLKKEEMQRIQAVLDSN